ncbi:MAG: hypothetical protein M3138_08540 [Actinomycetota bacterium]|nr:hypothetical protein [Actinomycetota bacterium]
MPTRFLPVGAAVAVAVGLLTAAPAAAATYTASVSLHTKHGSSFTMDEDLVEAAGDCRLVTARLTYSYPRAS